MNLPVGAVLLWNDLLGAVPAGWQLADGTNGTRNLVDRWLPGAGHDYAPGDTGAGMAATTSHDHGQGTVLASDVFWTSTQGDHTWSATVASSSGTVTAGVTGLSTVGDSGGSHGHGSGSPVIQAGSGSHVHALTATYDNQSYNQYPNTTALYWIQRVS